MPITASRCRRRSPGLIAVILILVGGASVAGAAEPRPWLCRQIPVFSGVKPMSWRATQAGAGRWVMTFMRYDPAGGHDGFTVVATQGVAGGTAAGTLAAGQYYAVAMHRAGGRWICPENAAADRDAAPGAVTNLCYGADEDGCDLKLVVSTSR